MPSETKRDDGLTFAMVPYSSVVGRSVSVADASGANVAIIMISVPSPSRNYREIADPLAEQICAIPTMRAALEAADEAINPPDRSGISLDVWNKRLKAATAQIRAALAQRAKES